jgi:NAD(P)-dependent dehydrogenase (short-subunit alcohol dehydrogenase family)
MTSAASDQAFGRPDGRLAGKVAVVVGAGVSGDGWGNGNATASEFAREGAVVVSVDHDHTRAVATRDLIIAEGGTSIALACDVTNAGQVADMVDRTIEAYGRIDVLHNNVGIVAVGGVVDMPEEVWDRVIDTNLKGMFLTCKYAIPAMLQGGGGAIVNVSSTSGIRWQGTPYISYAAAKSGVLQFTRSIAMEYADKGIRANILLPGLIDTPLVRNSLSGDDYEAVLKARNAACPMKRMGTPFEVAKAAVFLASDDASYITGAELIVDGALTCKI